MITIQNKGVKAFKKYLNDNNLNQNNYICRFSDEVTIEDKLIIKELERKVNNKLILNVIEPSFKNYTAFDKELKHPVFHFDIEQFEIYKRHLTILKQSKEKNIFNKLKSKFDNFFNKFNFGKSFGIGATMVFLILIFNTSNHNKNDITKDREKQNLLKTIKEQRK